jgi:tetratricopeptide (TPR) repeat protein
MNRLPVFLTSTLLVCVLLVAGCNVYEGLYEEGASDNPEVLLEDGRNALQQKRPTEAVAYLRKALEKAQDKPVLRKQIEIKLATAVLQEYEIDALSFSRIARKLSGDDAAGKVIASKTQSQTCNFPEHHGRTTFDPRGGIDFERIDSKGGAEALEEAQTLIARVLSGDETTANPTFPCEEAALNAAIANLQPTMSNAEIAEALVNYAIALTTEAYLEIVAAGGNDASFYYATPPGGTDYIGTCFTNAQSCENTIASTAANLSRFDCSTRIFQKRAELLDSSNAEELANLAREGYESLEVGVGTASCLTY